jgi:hypothetical protein
MASGSLLWFAMPSGLLTNVDPACGRAKRQSTGRAGYAGEGDVARTTAARLLTNAHIRAAIDAGMAELRQRLRTSLRTYSLRTRESVETKLETANWKPCCPPIFVR